MAKISIEVVEKEHEVGSAWSNAKRKYSDFTVFLNGFIIQEIDGYDSGRGHPRDEKEVNFACNSCVDNLQRALKECEVTFSKRKLVAKQKIEWVDTKCT